MIQHAAGELVALYGCVPMLPPDEATSIYLQPSTGCPTPVCTFCSFHRDPFRARTRVEFLHHLGRVREAIGPSSRFRSRLFLGDANALRVPADDLTWMIRQALLAFTNRAVHAYADATLHAHVDEAGLSRASEAGLGRVTMGLETGHRPLYAALGKPGRFDDLSSSLKRLSAARVGAGLTVLLGLGGREYRQKHVADTVEFLRSQSLKAPDVVYLLRYRPDPVTPYAAAAAADPDVAPTDEEYRLQERAFRQVLEKPLLARGVRLLSGDLVPVTLRG